MAEPTTTKLNPETHLLLDQPLLRMPYELSRKNYKAASRIFEQHRDATLKDLKNSANAALSAPDAPKAISDLDAMISRLQTLKRKLSDLQQTEESIQRQSKARIAHLNELYQIPSLADVKYDEWSRVRLDRLLVDYLLRSGYGESARQLAQEKGIEELVDVEAFVECFRVEESLRKGQTKAALVWCADNKQALKKINSNLEFELRLQQYIEMVRSGDTQKLMEATMHARKFLAPHQDTNFAIRAAGLLAFPPDTPAEPYKTLYSSARWEHLATLFVQTHHSLFSLPPRPLLHIALSAGLSALKTPFCHSQTASCSANALSSTTSVCPICSTELNTLARNVPYAHHTKSHVENDPVVLPNGRIYGSERLRQFNEMVGTAPGKIKDPRDPMGTVYDESQVKKVYIS
ncbi:GID complex subunit containing RING finger motif [Coniosporium apollinis]|uniref:GID complex subunit containing RING finger motif n=2 Tax=Coniosporium TaxID=2810619 RepID=A0ABQ9NSA9_9PEZI|nr:GID complex subunit containing RING finger motif [Cladosporium sp. JES 115]KAJ9665037.1 GID complex subunit containing RING finger motif [Coniosporium apollinis]